MIPDPLKRRMPVPVQAGLALAPATAAQIRERSRGAITRPMWAASEPELRRAGLFDPDIFGPGWEDPTPGAERERVEGTVDTFVRDVGLGYFGHIELGVPVAHPLTGEPLEAIAVLPPALRPLVYLHPARYSASDLNDLYERVIEISARLRRLRQLDPDHAARHAPELARAVERLFLNGSPQPARAPDGRTLPSIADHLRFGGREATRCLLWALGYAATWNAA